VDYAAAARLKLGWLKRAFERFDKDRRGRRLSEFDAFADAESFWLGDFLLFSAIQEEEGTADWTRWSEELRMRQPGALVRAQERLANEMRYHQFVQWQFFVQWQRLRAYCVSTGICLIGDLPQFVAHHSADVWAHPELFKLDGDGNPTVVAGVPPDYFSKTGQRWGLPVYRWEALRAQNYKWWIERLRIASRRFDANRLDHFIGFVRAYEVSAHAKTAVDGRYQPVEGAALFKAAREALGELHLIADDLGDTTPEVAALLDELRIPGARVLQFEFGSNLETNVVQPGRRPVRSVIYTGTHDNDTTAGWYRTLPNTQRQALQKKLRANDQEVVWAMIREAWASQADTAIVPAQDLLELGSEARMNVPGTGSGNWLWRLKNGALTQELAQRMRCLTITSGRLRSGERGPASGCQKVDPRRWVEKRAYDLYEQRGCQPGQSVQDWLEAERELAMEASR